MQSVCVFCGSRDGLPSHQQAARKLADTLIQNNLRLVYGGGKTGLMGLLADRMLSQGGEVTGIAPVIIASQELLHTNLTELIHTDTLALRKEKMLTLSDAFIILPGGSGTLDELFEVMTLASFKLHNKPCGILNVDGYYDSLLNFLGRAEQDNLLDKKTLNWLIQENDTDTLLQRLKDDIRQSSFE